MSYKNKGKTESVYDKWARYTISAHEKRGFIVDLERDILANLAIQTTHCILCGQELNWNGGIRTSLTPSLDRVNNEDFLNKDNIQILCVTCNTKKGSMTMSEYISYCDVISKRARGDNPDNIFLKEMEEARSEIKGRLKTARAFYKYYAFSLHRLMKDPVGIGKKWKEEYEEMMENPDKFNEWINNIKLVTDKELTDNFGW